MSTVVQGYRFALDPDLGQVAALRSHCGGQRYAYNWGLALVKANLDQRKAEASYGVPDDELTPALPWSAYRLLVGDSKRARWKPTSDPHRAGNGYRHGKTRPPWTGPTPVRQRTGCLNTGGPIFTHASGDGRITAWNPRARGLGT